MKTEGFEKIILNPNHPKLGSTIKVGPIRSIAAINNIKLNLYPTPRNYALFVMGINTAYRASELLSIRIGQVRHLSPKDRLEVKQKKTKKYRAVTINKASYEATVYLLRYLSEKAFMKQDHNWTDDNAYLFAGKNPFQAISVSSLNNLVKEWCEKAKLNGNFGSHTLRKTWGFMQRTQLDTPIPLLMQAFGHASQQQTLAYLCIQDEEIESIYSALEL